ncbi:hypothetical protein HPB50_007921 [Hyalomma asiaticum]|uniref:Uncharacterized protein n=1 Tax=Hyalomma asiaticum TaxID=266040 RepID=A0ACB7TEJ1_HYAAI|nr:hypothetical protein HPB50_007921 [Hyalomma asiaticum]
MLLPISLDNCVKSTSAIPKPPCSAVSLEKQPHRYRRMSSTPPSHCDITRDVIRQCSTVKRPLIETCSRRSIDNDRPDATAVPTVPVELHPIQANDPAPWKRSVFRERTVSRRSTRCDTNDSAGGSCVTARTVHPKAREWDGRRPQRLCFACRPPGAALSAAAARGGAPLSLTSVFIRECFSPSAAVRDSE